MFKKIDVTYNKYELMTKEWGDPNASPILTSLPLYFKTSGCAIQKLTQLEKDAWTLAGKVRAALGEAKEVKGDEKYLEVTMDEYGRIVCQPKSPRADKEPRPKGVGKPKSFMRNLRERAKERAMRAMQKNAKNDDGATK